MALYAEAVLECVGSANVLVELGEVSWIAAEVRACGEGKDGVLNLHGVEGDAVVELDDGGKVAAGAVVEDAGADAEDGFAVAWSVRERDSGREIVVVGEEGLPIVTEAYGELEFWTEFDLVLNERAEFVDPIQSAAGTLLCGEDVWSVAGVGG